MSPLDASRVLARNRSLLPFCPGLGVIGCGRLPAHSLPCDSTAILASKQTDGAKSPPLLSHSLLRGTACLAAGFPMPGTLHAGLAAPGWQHRAGSARLAVQGKPGSGTPPAACYPAGMFQLARPGLLTAFWQRTQGRHQRSGFSG